VFVVGHLGDWRAAAAVLFERHSLSGDSAPSREKREEVAASISAGIAISDYEVAGTLDKGIPGRGIGHNGNYDSQVVSVGGLCARTRLSNSAQDAQQGHLLPIALQDITAREKAQNGKGWNDDGSAYTVDTHATQGVAQPIAYNIAPGKGALKDDIHVTTADATKTLDASGSNPAMHQGGAAILQPISFSGQMSEPQTDVDMTQTLQARNPMAVCLMDQGGSVMNIEHDMSGTLRRETHGHEPIVMQQVGAFKPGQSAQAHSIGYENEMAPILEAGSGGNNKPAVHHGMAVRRLTPVECERLQGFPDNYTDIQPKGKATPDGPRYKALGNSMAVPVMAWIGKRIQEVEKMQCKPNK
jgi:DNA (cytosine-5)-methyltransferase 1